MDVLLFDDSTTSDYASLETSSHDNLSCTLVPTHLVIVTGKFSVNINTKTVKVDSVPVRLTGKEFKILELFSLRKGLTLTREMFCNHLYAGVNEPELKIIDIFICKLRRKLSDVSEGENYIETVWGRGYVFRDPATQQTVSA